MACRSGIVEGTGGGEGLGLDFFEGGSMAMGTVADSSVDV